MIAGAGADQGRYAGQPAAGGELVHRELDAEALERRQPEPRGLVLHQERADAERTRQARQRDQRRRRGPRCEVGALAGILLCVEEPSRVGAGGAIPGAR